jgi:hypothetical protein
MREYVAGSVVARDAFLDVHELMLNRLGPLIPIIIAIETVYKETRYRPSSLHMTRAEWKAVTASDEYLSVVKYCGPPGFCADPENPQALAQILNLRDVFIEKEEEP